jgi:hypothetical protein
MQAVKKLSILNPLNKKYNNLNTMQIIKLINNNKFKHSYKIFNLQH